MAAEEIPDDATGWRALLGSLPPRDLWRIVQADNALANRLLAGFRPGADAFRRPAVLARLADAALRDPALAESLLAIPPDMHAQHSPGAQRAPTRSSASAPSRLHPGSRGREGETGGAPPDDLKLRAKLKELRQRLREKDARLGELESALAAAQKARVAAETEVERERLARERAEARTPPVSPSPPAERRKSGEGAEGAKRRSGGVRALGGVPASGGVRESAGETRDALRRLLNRGRFETVADVCRELLATPAHDAGMRAGAHDLYAAALAGIGRAAEAREQDRLAVLAFLDSGQVAPAGEAFARLLLRETPGGLRPPEKAALERLAALADREGETAALAGTLRRVRWVAPAGWQRLHPALSGRGLRALREALEGSPARTVGPDEPIALPTPVGAASAATPREMARAVDANEEAWVAAARGALDSLREREPATVDALLEAVAALSPHGVSPLIAPGRGAVVVDASNVARHDPDPLARIVDGERPARVANLTLVRAHLLRRGHFPVLLIADANLGHRIDDRGVYRMLLARGSVREAPPGTSADEALIAEARHRAAPLVTNDRLKDWGEAAARIERIAFDIFADGSVRLTRT